MNLICREHESGIKIRFNGKTFPLKYPKKIWRTYPRKIKNTLIDNLAHLLTINFPLIAGIKKVNYNTSIPLFKPFFHRVVTASITAAIQEYDKATQDIIKRFMNTNYKFENSKIKIPEGFLILNISLLSHQPSVLITATLFVSFTET